MAIPASTKCISLLSVIMLGGCMNSEFSCPGYPNTPYCRSLSSAYKDSVEGRLGPGSKPDDTHKADAKTAQHAPPIEAQKLYEKPILIPPKAYRVWLAPWVDHNQVLHDATYLYVKIEEPGSPWIYGESVKPVTSQDITTTITPKAPLQTKPSPPAEANAKQASSAPPPADLVPPVPKEFLEQGLRPDTNAKPFFQP